jgi:hypothetical protein
MVDVENQIFFWLRGDTQWTVLTKDMETARIFSKGVGDEIEY